MCRGLVNDGFGDTHEVAGGAMSAVALKSVDKVYRSNQSIAYRLSG